METWRKIVMWCKDKKKIFTVEEDVMALQAPTIKNMIDDGCFYGKIPVVDVDGATLAKVIDYCYVHAHNHKDHPELDAWDTKFVDVDTNTLLDLLMAANYLRIESLVDLLFPAFANVINGKSIEELCEIFKMESRMVKNLEIKDSPPKEMGLVEIPIETTVPLTDNSDEEKKVQDNVGSKVEEGLIKVPINLDLNQEDSSDEIRRKRKRENLDDATFPERAPEMKIRKIEETSFDAPRTSEQEEEVSGGAEAHDQEQKEGSDDQ